MLCGKVKHNQDIAKMGAAIKIRRARKGEGWPGSIIPALYV